MARQLPLPGLEDLMLPTCDICMSPSLPLAQWQPHRAVFLCRACYEKLPRVEPHEWQPEIFATLSSERRQAIICDFQDAMEFMRQRRRQRAAKRTGVKAAQSKAIMPFDSVKLWEWTGQAQCARCGAWHNRTSFGGRLHDLCQDCDDQDTFDTLMRFQATIFAKRDLEDLLDLWYAVYPQLFKPGMLPDALFDARRFQSPADAGEE